MIVFMLILVGEIVIELPANYILFKLTHNPQNAPDQLIQHDIHLIPQDQDALAQPNL